MKTISLFMAVMTLACLPASAQRLPSDVVPENYRLSFTPNLDKNSFSGDETIRVRVIKPTATITLNSVDIKVEQAVVTSASASGSEAKVTSDPKAEMISLNLAQPLPAGPATIHMKFTGVLNDKLRGFYLSQTKRRKYAVTQFEATDARRAFPSFDEPAMKATFDITLVTDKNDTAISNGTVISDSPGPGADKHSITFSTTPKMSSYLVAMVVGDFECLSGEQDGIPIRICAVPEKKKLGGYALQCTKEILHFYDQYYGIKYPFKKLDVIALPDFAAGAMENTAAITYRETLLLIDDKKDSQEAHKAVFSVLAHEMAHQWFGDLVTMQWWDNVWLNEGFATWMANKPMEALRPQWHAELNEVNQSERALGTDAIASVRAIRAKSETSAEISTMFDAISYQKGGSVLRMVEAYVGPEVFRRGVNNYLQKHAYGNATAEDFWNEIASASGKPADKIMESFVTQSGAPLITVRSSCAGSNTQVTLAQQRFYGDRKKLESGSPEKWEIPVCFKETGPQGDESAKTASSCKLMTEREQTFELPGCRPWVFANAGGQGYFRTGYDSGTVSKIAATLGNTRPAQALSDAERISFLEDTWALVRVGREPVDDYLGLISSMQQSRTAAVVDDLLQPLNTLHDQIATSADRPAFEAWVRRALQPAKKSLGFIASPVDTGEARELRGTLLYYLAHVGKDPDAIDYARKMTAQYMADPASVDAEMATNALNLAAENGDAALYAQYLDHMKSAKTPEEHYRFFHGLGYFQDPALVRRSLEYAISPEVKTQDSSLLRELLSRPETQAQAWEFVKSNNKQIMGRLGSELGSGFIRTISAFCSAELRDDALNFFGTQDRPGTARTLRNATDRINSCIDLRNTQGENLARFLKAHAGAAASGGN